MNVIECSIPGILIFEPRVFDDPRGFFYEGFNQEKVEDLTGIDFQIKQLNFSRSTKNVLRGLHFQKNPKAQSKFISCIQGEILDVVVDIRKNSPTYGQSEKILLTNENFRRFYVPAGFAHGFLVVSESAEIMYAVDETYSAEHDSGIYFNDPDLNIDWGVSQDQLILSEKDKKLPLLKEADINFTYHG